MKTLLTILLTLSIGLVFSQDCEYLTNETDPFTNQLKKVTKWKELAKGATERRNRPNYKLRIALFKQGDIKGFMCYYNNDLGCRLKDNSYIQILLEDSTNLIFMNISDDVCSTSPILGLLLDDVEQEKLKSSPIKIIRYCLRDGYDDLVIITKPNYFKDNLNCLE